jgi:Leucine-rich repeat (LRR) protein
MHTLEQLQSGSLIGTQHLKLACGLTEFPKEIYALADTLELLDLSGNQLFELPDDMFRFKKLKIAFFSDNLFTEFPKSLGLCPELEMIGFKANQILNIAEGALPAKTRWLILTNNQIKTLPRSIGSCIRMQKLMLAGNQLESLPEEMAHCVNIELLRISANRFQSLPDWLLDLPKLSWLAYAGNVAFKHLEPQGPLAEIAWGDLHLQGNMAFAKQRSGH